MDRIYLGGKTLYGGIGDILYFIYMDPLLQRIAGQAKQEYKPELSIWSNRTPDVMSLFDADHFDVIIYNDEENHEPMNRPRTILEIPDILKDIPPKVYPVPLRGFTEPKHPYFVCHLEVMEQDNELEYKASFWELLKGLTRGVTTYVLGTGEDEFDLPDNFVDYRGKTDLVRGYHLTRCCDRYIGTTSVWYLLALLMKKQGWSFNKKHEVLFNKLMRLYQGLDLINSRVEAFDIDYE